MTQVNLAVVGAGILGLAHAYHAARAGLSVAVFERSGRANGASTRNFGMLAIAAQADGEESASALRTLDHWKTIAAQADIGLKQSGCLFLARVAEELDVIEEYAARLSAPGNRIIKPAQLANYSDGLNTGSILAALWNADAWKVDQRAAADKLALWLQREYGVTFHFDTEVTAIAPPEIETRTGGFRCDQAVVCGGSEFSTLFPDAFKRSGVTQCVLQMLRTQPQKCTIGPFILGGLSLTRYNAFADCASLANLIDYQQRHYRSQLDHGIHVVAAQEADGSITIGDSHRYQQHSAESRMDDIDTLILHELNEMIALPDLQIQQRWLGHYASLPDSALLRLSPADRVTAVTVTNGQGMTHGLAVAEDTIRELIR